MHTDSVASVASIGFVMYGTQITDTQSMEARGGNEADLNWDSSCAWFASPGLLPHSGRSRHLLSTDYWPYYFNPLCETKIDIKII